MNVLPKAFYLSKDVVRISKLLLGNILVTEIDGVTTKAIIVETEAYRSPDDRACHAFNDNITPRTKTMFEEGGRAYIYLCYGLHRMINVVTYMEGHAHAVLVRAVEPIDGVNTMANRRGHDILKKETTNGPGKLCQAMGIDTSMDGTLLYDPASSIKILKLGDQIEEEEIVAGPRVGLSKLTGPDAHRPWRFYIRGNRYVSNPKTVTYPEEWKLL